MYLTIPRHKLKKRDAFTLIEAITATFVGLYVFLGVWAIYTMSWSWWNEMVPRIEAERIARVALTSIIEGTIDPTAGTCTVGSTTYSMRNGIAWAKLVDDIAYGTSVTSINFGLDPDSSKVRSFYLGVDATTGLGVVYYKDSNSVVHMIKPTLGITDLRFEKTGGEADMLKVTTSVTKNVLGTRKTAYPVTVTYSDSVYLRNL
jgi:hypothetical protein